MKTKLILILVWIGLIAWWVFPTVDAVKQQAEQQQKIIQQIDQE